MAKHKKPRVVFDKDATALDVLMYEIEHGWLGIALMLGAGISLFIVGAAFGWIKGNI